MSNESRLGMSNTTVSNLVDRLAGLSPALWGHFLSQRALRNVSVSK